MATYKLPYFNATITNPIVIKNGHSGAVFKNNDLTGFYADVELKTNLNDSITFRLEDASIPDFVNGETYIEVLDNWINVQLDKYKI